MVVDTSLCNWLPFDADLRKEPLWRTYRGLIVHTDVTTTSIVQSLVSGKITSLQPGTPLSVHCDYKLDNGIVFNLIECLPVSLSLFSLLLIAHLLLLLLMLIDVFVMNVPFLRSARCWCLRATADGLALKDA